MGALPLMYTKRVPVDEPKSPKPPPRNGDLEPNLEGLLETRSALAFPILMMDQVFWAPKP